MHLNALTENSSLKNPHVLSLIQKCIQLITQLSSSKYSHKVNIVDYDIICFLKHHNRIVTNEENKWKLKRRGIILNVVNDSCICYNWVLSTVFWWVYLVGFSNVKLVPYFLISFQKYCAFSSSFPHVPISSKVWSWFTISPFPDFLLKKMWN